MRNADSVSRRLLRDWPLVGFVAGLLLWAWVLVAERLLLLDTNLGLVMALMSSAILSVPALVFALLARRWWPFGVFLAASFAIVVLCAAPWHPRKRFLSDFYGLIDPREATPTVAQMRRRMARWTEVPCGLASAKGPEPPVCFAWDVREIRDVGEVWIVKGRVSRLNFRGF